MVNVTLLNRIPTAIQLVNDSGQIHEIHPLECVYVFPSHAEYLTKAGDSGRRLTRYLVSCWYGEEGDDYLQVFDGIKEIPYKEVVL